MKKIIAAILTLCILLSAFAVSSLTASAAETESLTENEEYRRDFINALLNRTSLWKKDDSYTSYYFMDLDLDGKNEFVVWNYGGTSRLHYTHIFAYVNGSIVELTKSTQNYSKIDPKECINTETFKYYYNKQERRLMILGTFVIANGVGNYINKNYDITFDINKKAYPDTIKIEYYTGLEATTKVGSQNTTMRYYRELGNGKTETLDKTGYDNWNYIKTMYSVDLHMEKQSINAYSYSKMTSTKKRAALEESYDAFYCDWFILGYDTNAFKHEETSYTIDNETYRNWLKRDTTGWIDSYSLNKSLDGSQGKGGVCHGIAQSICYAKNGDLDLKVLNNGKDAECYYELGSMYDDGRSKFKDLVTYYFLTQYTDNGKESDVLTKIGFASGKLEDRLAEFLKSLKKEAVKAQREHMPFLFGLKWLNDKNNTVINNIFGHKKVGHSIVVCGYKYDSSTKEHLIVVYNENTYPAAKLEYIRIADDYSNLKFPDSLCGDAMDDNWTCLKFWSLEKLYGEVAGYSVTKAKGDEKASVSAGNICDISVSFNKEFRLTNAEGKYLEYDGINYSGNMEVYNCSLIDNADGTESWRLTVDKSDSYHFVSNDEECSLLGETYAGGFRVYSEDPAVFDVKNDTITATGSDIDFEVTVQTSSDSDMIGVSGQSDSGFIIKNSGGKGELWSAGELSDIKVTSNIGDEVNTEIVNGPRNTVSVEAKSGEIVGNPHLLGDADSDGSVTILDATRIQRRIAELTVSSFSKKASDADQDGEVTILDATAIQRHLAGLPTNKNIGTLIE